jgi:hypothetical protein
VELPAPLFSFSQYVPAAGFSCGCIPRHFLNNCSLVSVCLGSGWQASTGHTSAQRDDLKEPTHSVHFSWSMMKKVSPALIALLGHTGSQAPQLMQSSEI